MKKWPVGVAAFSTVWRRPQIFDDVRYGAICEASVWWCEKSVCGISQGAGADPQISAGSPLPFRLPLASPFPPGAASQGKSCSSILIVRVVNAGPITDVLVAGAVLVHVLHFWSDGGTIVGVNKIFNGHIQTVVAPVFHMRSFLPARGRPLSGSPGRSPGRRFSNNSVFLEFLGEPVALGQLCKIGAGFV